jgi:PTS system maltose and glucose-specific IIC component
MSKKSKAMEFFSAFGRSLMLPIAMLAAVGILLGLSAALTKPQIQEAMPFLTNHIVLYVIVSIKSISAQIFGLIPVLFSISIALGLAKKEKEIAAMAGFIGYYIMLWSASLSINSGLWNFGDMGIASILGINNTLQMGAVAGMLSGILVSMIHNKYYNVQFPVAIAFFGGKRFVAIAVIACLAIVGQIIPFIWIPISSGINALGILIASLGSFGIFLFGMLERLLIPTGLHHILNGVFRTTSVGGTYQGVDGVLNIFFSYFGKVSIEDLKPFTSFLGQGKMPYMMFGLPAAALAIYNTTPAEKKSKVKALMIAGVAASFVTGITEPLEFSFLFIAPVLFLFHSVMAGLSFGLMSALGVGIGNTGGGVIDFTIYGIMVPGSRWYMVIIVGLIYAVIYYSVFRWYLLRKNITIDTSDDFLGDESIATGEFNGVATPLAAVIIDGLGGFGNVEEVNNCITRLRVDVKDMSLVDEAKLKSTGALGIVKPSSTHIHVIYGPKVEGIASQVREGLSY